LISSEWHKDGNNFNWHITVPANTTATVYVPAKSAEAVTESGRSTDKSKGMKFLRMENGRAVFEIGSGEYQFASR
jgi:alpha-L-rhamnosidase